MNIQLEKTSDAKQIKCGTVYNYGTLKVGDHQYPFTIAEMVNDNPRWIESEVVWAEDTPPDQAKAETAIMSMFDDMGTDTTTTNDREAAIEDAARGFLKFMERSGMMENDDIVQEAEALYTAFAMPASNGDQATKDHAMRNALQKIVDELKEYGFIGKEGVGEEDENHWSGSPSIMEAIELLNANK